MEHVLGVVFGFHLDEPPVVGVAVGLADTARVVVGVEEVQVDAGAVGLQGVECSRPAPFPPSAGSDSARSGFAAGGRFVQARTGVALRRSGRTLILVNPRNGHGGNGWEERFADSVCRPPDTSWEANAPSYRVYFWRRPPAGPLSGLGTMAYLVESFEIDGVDIAVLLAWAETTASPDRTYTP